MKVTEVKFRKVNKGNLIGFADVVFDKSFVVRGLKVLIGGSNGYFVGFPSQKGSDGQYYETAHPLNAKLRKEISNRVLDSAGVNSNSSYSDSNNNSDFDW